MRLSIAPAVQRLDASGRRVLDVDGFLAECAAAEHGGWFGAYTGEKHRGDTTYTTSPLQLCHFGLAHTERLLFGTCVSVLPVHHPVTLAEEAALLDALYPERFRLTVGAGYFSGDFEPFGVDLAERERRMVAGMDAINAHRRSQPMTLDGPWSGIVPPRDPALGDDHLDVFVGAWSIAGVRRAARQADGWITDPIRSGRWISRLADVYREECEQAGRTPRIVLLREAWLDETDDRARAVYGPHVLGYSRVYYERGNAYDPRFDPWLVDVPSASSLTLDHVLPDRVLCGARETWLEQIGAWLEALAPEEIIVRLRHFQGPTLDETLESLARITDEILPTLAG